MICENCGKEHDGSYGSGRFCSKECARSYATNHEQNKHQLKEAKCVNCGKIIYINKRSSINNCLCKECKKHYHKPSDIKYCNICGRKYFKYEGGCQNEFCKQHSIKQLNTLIKYFNFDKTKLKTQFVEDEFNNVKNVIYNLYWKENKSFTDIANKFNYKSNPGNLSKIFKYLNIPIRSFKDSSINAFINGKMNYKESWHITWNNKEVYLRSSYELDYAKELDEQHVDYDVEIFHIKYWDSQKLEYRCAIPDFYIPSTNTIVEIKSNWTLDKQNMIDKFKAYKELGYNCKLICDYKEMIL
jgi:hypothetical protein